MTIAAVLAETRQVVYGMVSPKSSVHVASEYLDGEWVARCNISQLLTLQVSYERPEKVKVCAKCATYLRHIGLLGEEGDAADLPTA